MKLLVTGGAGYVGSHMVLLLLQAGHEVVVLDNLSTSKREVLQRVSELAGRKPTFIEGDVRDAQLLDRLFASHAIEVVVHFAGLKAVGESVENPLAYYDNNVVGTLRLCQAMSNANVKRLVFSSTASVYGDPDTVPVKECAALRPANPYGRSKLHIEQMLLDLRNADPEWRIAILRYFNPAGAHESGRIGEDPSGIPNNLMPYIAQVAVGKRERLSIFGNDYPTSDGTAVRDYIHVMDLVEGHLAAIRKMDELGLIVCNLGTGKGCTVMEVLKAFSEAFGQPIPHVIAERRKGDVPEYFADPALANELLGWTAKRSLERICRDHWAWQRHGADLEGHSLSPQAPR